MLTVIDLKCETLSHSLDFQTCWLETMFQPEELCYPLLKHCSPFSLQKGAILGTDTLSSKWEGAQEMKKISNSNN